MEHIPDVLLENANAVVRQQNIEFNVQAPDRAVYKERRVITIFNDKTHYDKLVVNYDPSQKLGYISGRIYDAAGNFVRKISKKEIKDESAISSFSIYEDNRIRYVDVDNMDYPYTVEFEYEMSYKELLFYPNWQIDEFNTAVEQAVLQVSLPANMQLHYKTYNLGDLQPRMENTEKRQRFTWQVENIKAVKREPYCPPANKLLPAIFLSPGEFRVGGYTGSLSSWEAFGQFMNQLMDGRDELTPTMKQTVSELIRDATNDREKIDILYRYMQENMRYVSVQLGIGGWQPFDAKYVEANKYGDCKALSNFMKALLKEAGIKAYPVLISSGHSPFPLSADFAYPAFNHMILHVPSEDYWLECTSNISPPNYIGSDNSDRNILLLTENGGQIGHSPALSPQDNSETNTTHVILNENGAAEVSFSSVCTGNRQDDYRWARLTWSEEELRKEMMETIPLPSFKLGRLSVEANPDRPEVRVEYTAQVPGYASKAGKRLFLPLNPINPCTSIPPNMDTRIHPVVLHDNYTEQDTIVVHLPGNYHVESMPPAENILDNDFAKYSLRIFQKENTLTIIRQLEVKSVRLPPAEYNSFRNFFKNVAKMDDAKAVLINKT